MLPRCTLSLETSSVSDWTQYIRTLADDELWPAYEKACADSHANGTYTATFLTIRASLRDEMSTRFQRVLNERDFAMCELGKAKAQQRMETLKTYSPKRRDQYAD